MEALFRSYNIQNGGAKIDYKTSSLNNMSTDDIYKLTDLYFKQKNIKYSHLHNSFDKFLDDDVRSLLEGDNNYFFEKVTKDTIYRYKFVYSNISIEPPMIDNDEVMYPNQARIRNLTYAVKLVATITQVQDIIDIATDNVVSRVIGQPEHEYPIATIPVMLRTKYCSLNLNKGVDKSECDYDPGGYFIVNGSEKVIMSLERKVNNEPLVFTKKDANTLIYTVQVNSVSTVKDTLQIVNIKMKKDNTMWIKVPIINEVSVFIVMRALGIESDQDIINYTVYDTKDVDMINLVRVSLENCKDEATNLKLLSQEDAINYLISKIRVLKKYKYSDTDKNLRHLEKRSHLMDLLKNSFLPHIEGGLIYKGFYIGYMINRLLQCKLGRIDVDDRDSFVNKRVDLPGTLLFELFKQAYKKMLNECTKFFKKRNNDDNNPQNIINQIKPNIIEQGIKSALSTGTWGKKKGVAQMLQRLSYMQMLSSLRRINSPTVDASTNKLTSPRHLHPSQVGCICYIETSEGHKVGLVKNLSLMGNVTIMMPHQLYLLKSLIKNKIIDVQDVPPNKIINYTKVFINGEWMGLTDRPRELYDFLKQKKLNCTIDPCCSIIHEIKTEVESKKLKIYCDGGRLFRPLLRVSNNEVLLNKKHIDLISLEEHDNVTKITSWNDFMKKNPGVIEYIDSDEQFSSMIAMFQSDVETMRVRKEESIESIKKFKIDSNYTIINRYDDFLYVNYTHAEIHPLMQIGTVAANIVFSNCNQAPRNIFQYSQARQAMCIYATNYRDRLDIGYILYNPQRPIVSTRAMKYINTDILPYGENAIVALATYTGFNQEDSVIINQSSIDRGFMRSTNLKKYQTTIQKNQSTSQDDMFIKPDPSKVTGMRPGSYDKLNEQGYVPEEVEVVNGDIIIGKVSPINPIGQSNKTFKDNSEVYKSHIPGVIDRVWTKIYNHEGYEMRKMRVRSERIPCIGDKVCSRSGQKGTIGLTLPCYDMPFTKDGITPDIIVNPNAIPSRMTIGQLIECLVGKVSTIMGQEADGTPFQKWDLEAVKDILEKLGYERNACEYLYNGMTGKKMSTMIFIGPTYYQRLKHMVNDKLHSRSQGPRTMLTRQAPEGRSRDGGLRFGEMERDCIISHGMARFLKERMLETADAYSCYVCQSCGLFAQRMIRRDNKPYATKKDIYHCPSCRNKNNIAKVRIPYAFKLLIQEMMSMNIAPRIRIKESKYTN